MLLGDAYVHLLGHQLARQTEQKRRSERVIKTVPRLLTLAMQSRDLEPKERLAAGKLLADLGELPPDLDAFISIPDQPFRIGKYPVPNHQYARFMAAGGYQDDRWWTDDEGQSYRNDHGWNEPRWWTDDQFNWPTQPMVGISWYEANAYCAWLTEHLLQSQTISENEEVRLPTEDEWMAAAHVDEATFPWGGDEFDPALASTVESELGQTSPVHMYPEGQTQDGVWDLSGNIWEWRLDTDDKRLRYRKGAPGCPKMFIQNQRRALGKFQILQPTTEVFDVSSFVSLTNPGFCLLHSG